MIGLEEQKRGDTMIIRLIKKSKIYNFTLPKKVSGSYWVTDDDKYGNVRNLINVEAENGVWKIKSDFYNNEK